MRNSLAFTLRRVVNEFWELLQIQSITLILLREFMTFGRILQ